MNIPTSSRVDFWLEFPFGVKCVPEFLMNSNEHKWKAKYTHQDVAAAAVEEKRGGETGKNGFLMISTYGGKLRRH